MIDQDLAGALLPATKLIFASFTFRNLCCSHKAQGPLEFFNITLLRPISHMIRVRRTHPRHLAHLRHPRNHGGDQNMWRKKIKHRPQRGARGHNVINNHYNTAVFGFVCEQH